MGYVAKIKTGSVYNPIGATLFGICDSAADTPDKRVTISGLSGMPQLEGLTIHAYFTNSNTYAGNATIMITIVDDEDDPIVSARPLLLAGSRPVGSTPETSWIAKSVLSLTYYSGRWFVTGWLNTNTTYPTVSAQDQRNGLMTWQMAMALDDLQDGNIDTLANISVPANWTDDTSVNGGPKYPDYPKKTTVTITGVSSSMVPTVVFDPAVSAEYGIAPVAETGANSLTLYAETAPAAAVTILTLVLQSGHGTL